MEKYAIELWSRAGLLLADISPLVYNFRYSLQRNEAEQLSFTLNLVAFEDFCLSIGTSPMNILYPYQTDIKVKRNGVYLFGTHVGLVDIQFGETDMEINVNAFGYLNLLIDRYVTKSYLDVDATDIAWDLISETQSQTNGDMNITQGSTITTVSRERNYDRQNVKEAIVNLTKLIDGNFDFKFTYDRIINFYTMQGSDLSKSIQFVYPGNVVSASVPRDGTALFNKIYGVGSGFGADQLTSTQEDEASELNFGVHEKIITFNSNSLQETLDQNTAGQLRLRKDILEIPQMTVNGDDFDLNSYGIGDRVTVRIDGHTYVQVNGVYRIEKLEVEVDPQHAEMITPYFDNIDADQTGYLEDSEVV